MLSSPPEIPYDEGVVLAIQKARPLVARHMAQEIPNEACGLILDDGTITHLINQARSPDRFVIGQRQLLDAVMRVDPNKNTIVAFYHSHPGGSPNLSLDDQASMSENWRMGLPVPWVVITESVYRLWWVSEHSTYAHADLRELATSCIP